jgi:hypothetical protein
VSPVRSTCVWIVRDDDQLGAGAAMQDDKEDSKSASPVSNPRSPVPSKPTTTLANGGAGGPGRSPTLSKALGSNKMVQNAAMQTDNPVPDGSIPLNQTSPNGMFKQSYR